MKAYRFDYESFMEWLSKEYGYERDSIAMDIIGKFVFKSMKDNANFCTEYDFSDSAKENFMYELFEIASIQPEDTEKFFTEWEE